MPVSEVAALLGESADQVRRRIACRDLEGVKVPAPGKLVGPQSRVRIRESSVRQFLARIGAAQSVRSLSADERREYESAKASIAAMRLARRAATRSLFRRPPKTV